MLDCQSGTNLRPRPLASTCRSDSDVHYCICLLITPVIHWKAL